jgi:peptidoglycan/LPS O-acetylase OafA/YrhL
MLYHVSAKFHLNLPFLESNAFIAVDFFFVLSGYVICYSYGHKIINGMRSSEYLLRRVARLFPMMALGLLLGSPAIYITTLSVDNQVYIDIKEIVVGDLYNIMFIPYLNFDKYPEMLSEPSGIIFPADSPLWSISFEMLASLLFVRLIFISAASLTKICLVSFVVLVFTSFLHGTAIVGNNVFDIERGWRTISIWGGLPRVLFGFSFGMIIYQIEQTPSRYPWTKRFQNLNAHPDWVLYCALTAMLIFPFRLLGLYSVFAVYRRF